MPIMFGRAASCLLPSYAIEAQELKTKLCFWLFCGMKVTVCRRLFITPVALRTSTNSEELGGVTLSPNVICVCFKTNRMEEALLCNMRNWNTCNRSVLLSRRKFSEKRGGEAFSLRWYSSFSSIRAPLLRDPTCGIALYLIRR